MPATEVEPARITTSSVKLIRRAEVTNRMKTYQAFRNVDQQDDVSRSELRLYAYEYLKEWHARLALPIEAASEITGHLQETQYQTEVVLTAKVRRSDFVERRLLARQRARDFVCATAEAYEATRGAEALAKAINVVLELIAKEEYAVMDSIFEQLIDRVTETASSSISNDAFPREGSFWIACLTLTKGAAKQLDFRNAFITLLRGYAASVLEPNVAKRLLRNVD